MGTSVTSTTQQATPTPEETKLNQQQIAMNEFMQPYAKQNYADLSTNISAILQGKTPMAQGIGGVDATQTQDMVNASLRDIMPQFQSGGIMDSGMAAQVASRTAADTRNQQAQFNVSAAQNLFNLASGGQSNLQGQLQNNTNNLSNTLAGLRTTTSRQSVQANPFQTASQMMQGVGSMASGFGSMGFGPCWVAAELFDGWSDVRTSMARFYILFHSPKWFRNMYIKFGKSIADFIHNKPILKNILKPLFELFASKGKEKLNGR